MDRKEFPGAFEIKAAHDHGEVRAIISQDEKNAYLDGQFFLETTKGKDAFVVVKENGERRQWSYAYEIEKSHEGTFGDDDDRTVLFFDKIDVFEASPVLVGSNTRTRTLGVKDDEDFPAMKLDDHAVAVFDAVAGLIERTEEIGALRASDGRHLGDKHIERIEALIDLMTVIKAGVPILELNGDVPGDGLAAPAAAASATARLRGVAIGTH